MSAEELQLQPQAPHHRPQQPQQPQVLEEKQPPPPPPQPQPQPQLQLQHQHQQQHPNQSALLDQQPLEQQQPLPLAAKPEPIQAQPQQQEQQQQQQKQQQLPTPHIHDGNQILNTTSSSPVAEHANNISNTNGNSNSTESSNTVVPTEVSVSQTNVKQQDQQNNNNNNINSNEKIKEKKRKKKRKRPAHKSKMITGYIIYASEIRKDVIKKYPDLDFGDISKLVGIEWKKLSQETKIAYEKRAQEQNAKSKAVAAEALELKKLADAADEKAAALDPKTNQPTNDNNNNNNSCETMNSASPKAAANRLMILPHNDSFSSTHSMYQQTMANNQLQPQRQQQQIQTTRPRIVRPPEPKKPLRFSQKFIDYLKSKRLKD